MRVNIADSVISIILIFTLLPMYGIRGYVAVIFITELFNTSFSLVRLLKVSCVPVPFIKWVIKPLLSIISATVIGRMIFNGYLVSVLNGSSPLLKRVLVLEIALTSFVYVLICAAVGTVLTSLIKYLIKKLKNPTRV
jgi:stage V sporulation protein B